MDGWIEVGLFVVVSPVVVGCVGDCLDASAHPEHFHSEMMERSNGRWRLRGFRTQPELVGVKGRQFRVSGGCTVLVLRRGGAALCH